MTAQTVNIKAIIDLFISEHSEELINHDLHCWRYPMEEFETLCGIKGVSKTYKMPHGKEPVEVAREIDRLALRFKAIVKLLTHDSANSTKLEALKAEGEKELAALHPHLLNVYTQLEELNPELRTLPVDHRNPNQLWDAIWGITSHFNVPDIHWYTIEDQTMEKCHQSPQWVQRHTLITRLGGHEPGLVTAPSTQLLILQKLKQLGKNEEKIHR